MLLDYRISFHVVLLRAPDVLFYPLRPEFAESTYHLYRATKNPFYLHVGREIMESIDLRTRVVFFKNLFGCLHMKVKVECGFATVHNVLDGSLEDRMESFFLSETMKYLYLVGSLEPCDLRILDFHISSQSNMAFQDRCKNFYIEERTERIHSKKAEHKNGKR